MSLESTPVTPDHTGKVRDSYFIDKDSMLVVASDRVSVYDVVLPTEIPDKGKRLTEISRFWMQEVFPDTNHHLITTSTSELPEDLKAIPDIEGRSSVVRRAKMLPLECIVRGYLYGSVVKEYVDKGTATGIELPVGLQLASQLEEPIFTPSTKATVGHDENITFEQAQDLVSLELLGRVRDKSIGIYLRAAEHAIDRGIILADTKFEFGIDNNGKLMLCDEVLTPDSSRFWDAETWEPGKEPTSFDKQFVRNYCTNLGWDKTPENAPELPGEIVAQTQEKYDDAVRALTS